ncbi:MAG: hypothetical protein R3174_08235 [Gammaproteobacteria bacterium]|nr:hypothetical protein [Gammaproteobacteria bacterium]
MIINADCALPDISSHGPFKAVMSIEQSVSADRQAEISSWLVEMGCRYVMACGKDSDSWCESIRAANRRTLDVDHLEARDIVMTTSHVREPMRSVFWFAKKVANHPEVAFESFFVIHLAERDRSTEFTAIYEKA